MIQQCNGTLPQVMVELEAAFVVSDALSEAGKGKGKGKKRSGGALSSRGVRVAAATAALAASQAGLVALAVA